MLRGPGSRRMGQAAHPHSVNTPLACQDCTPTSKHEDSIWPWPAPLTTPSSQIPRSVAMRLADNTGQRPIAHIPAVTLMLAMNATFATRCRLLPQPPAEGPGPPCQGAVRPCPVHAASPWWVHHPPGPPHQGPHRPPTKRQDTTGANILRVAWGRRRQFNSHCVQPIICRGTGSASHKQIRCSASSTMPALDHSACYSLSHDPVCHTTWPRRQHTLWNMYESVISFTLRQFQSVANSGSM